MSILCFLTDLGFVECSSALGCTNSDLGAMTARDCCIGNSEGLAYTASGSEVCHTCIGKSPHKVHSYS